MEIPADLVEDLLNKRCFPFVGAGFSKNTVLPEGRTMPSWGEMGQRLAQRGHFPDSLGPMDLASLYNETFGRSQLTQLLRTELHCDEAKPGRAHQALVRLNFRIIYTTNYDSLLEDACSSVNIRPNVVSSDTQFSIAPRRNMTTIVKMHGCLNGNHIVLTREDYDSFFVDHPVFVAHVANMFITETALFIGYSLRDPDFRQMRAVVLRNLKEFRRPAYLIGRNISVHERKLLAMDKIVAIDLGNGGADGTHEDDGQSYGDVLTEFFEELGRRVATLEDRVDVTTKPEQFEHPDKTKIASVIGSVDSRTGSAVLSSTSNTCYISYEPDSVSVAWYAEGVLPALEQLGLIPVKPSQAVTTPRETEPLIRQAKLIIAIARPNADSVLFDLSMAQRFHKPIVLLASRAFRADQFLSRGELNSYYQGGNIAIVRRTSRQKADAFAAVIEKAVNHSIGVFGFAQSGVLIQEGRYLESVVRTIMALEMTLRVLGSQTTPKSEQFGFSMSQMLTHLTAEGIIDTDRFPGLLEAVKLRNKAVHAMVEVTRNQAESVLETVSHFVKEALGERFWADLQLRRQ